MSEDVEWFESWFGEDYVALYPHRDEAEAARAVDLIEHALDTARVDRVLDLACGSGRHARYLGQRWWTSGVDLSEVLLRIAQRKTVPARLVRADIRALPYRDACFDLVVNLFTSFGYFETDEEHEAVIHDVAQITRKRGTFVLDYLNSSHVRQHLVPFDSTTIGKHSVAQRRSITDDGRFVVKHIVLRDKDKEFIERVRLFDKAQLVGMLERAGFQIAQLCGGYDGEPWTEESPRVILFARRN